MRFLTTLRCPACRYTSPPLALGEGDEGRGIPGRCPRCRDLGTILVPHEGDAEGLVEDGCRWCEERLEPQPWPTPCPQCRTPLLEDDLARDP
jgi:ssDNA-binding Zn-finger/Zn-ribbon topoisomerase 1